MAVPAPISGQLSTMGTGAFLCSVYLLLYASGENSQFRKLLLLRCEDLQSGVDFSNLGISVNIQ